MALADCKSTQERWAARRRQEALLPYAFGSFVADLAAWDWFGTITFRPFWQNTVRRRKYEVIRVEELTAIPHGNRPPDPFMPPCQDAAMEYIREWLAGIGRQASRIGWLVAEEHGRRGGRWHCHFLITGVATVSRKWWWREAYRRFGRTRIEPFDPKRGAAFYAAKYAAKQLGALHFGGTLAGVDLSLCEKRGAAGSGEDIAPSVDLPKTSFHLGLGRWHR